MTASPIVSAGSASQAGPVAAAPDARERWSSLRQPAPGLRTRAGAIVARRLFLRAMAGLPVTVRLHERGGIREVGLGGPVMEVLRPDELFARLGRDASIGLGEAYLTGAWDAEDLGGFLTVPAGHLDSIIPPILQRLRRRLFPVIAADDRGDVEHTQGNIAHHYDLSNDFFELFLDPTMTYSAAWFPTENGSPDGAPIPGSDLISAQHRKIDELLDQAGVGPGSRVLEIGTGWGELALRAAARGATVRSLTLSVEQQGLALERIAAAGFAEQVQIDLLDYRLVQGEYDAVVSVEMIEAVGWRHWSTYFAAIERVLAPGGKVAIQGITMPHEWMLATRDEDTWITKYIFPGGFLPSTEALEEAAAESGLSMRITAALGLHYAETLRQWDVACTARADELKALGFDETFARMWHYYLCYSLAGFASGYINDHHLVFERKA